MTKAEIESYLAAYGKLPGPKSWERPTTENLHGGDAMMQTGLDFSHISRPLPPNPYRTNSQRYRIYRRLAMYGRVKNFEIMFGLGGPRIMNGTGRTSEIREFLRDFGFRLVCNRINDNGVFEYEVRP